MKSDNNRSDKRIILIFCAIMIIGGVAGFLFGLYSKHINYDGIAGIIKSNMAVIAYALLVVFVLMTVILIFLTLLKHGEAKRTALLAKEDEDLYETAESKTNSCILISSVASVTAFVLSSFSLWIIVFSDVDLSIKKVLLFSSLPLFLINLFWSLYIQRASVDLIKKINPEKRGNILDIKFDKTWEESCDEGELRSMYEAGYRAYMFTTKLCYVMFLIACISMVVLHTGIFPIICIETIHLSLILSNYHAAKKHKRR
ncbi:MAG: DUF3169 family protein, partial [Clostridia bacterium]|nr:DUF3169 family protein [Clostridia bacterium]